MPANRPNLTLDEQSFQGLLSAAFTIQEHNDRLKLAGPIPAEPQARLEQANICPHCGAPKAAEGSRCESCGLDEFRPGERLQHNWASMWLMSQEQRLWPGRSPIAQEETAIIQQREPGKAAAEGRWITEATDDFPREGLTQENLTQEELRSEDSDLAVQPFQLSAFEDSYATDATTDASISLDGNAPSSVLQRFADWHVKVRFHRADLYLGVAIFVAVLALLWPAAGAPRPAALGPWERALVTLGIAEVPAPIVHFQGDPSLAVWVDPHTALYYCPGEEQYGKTADGRFSPQREAQMDRFEPASRSACE
jgi:ribosomal protein L40E